jgi:coatomer subunit beta
MDILRVLASPDLEVRKKTMDLVFEVMNTRNIHEVVMVLKKEITKTHTEESTTEDSGNYRQILVRTLHACSVKFPDVAESVVPVVSILKPVSH